MMMAGFASATPVNITNANLDDNSFGFSQGVPTGWSSTGASWYGNGSGAHTGVTLGTPGSAFDGSFYMNGNGFPGPNGGSLFQDVSGAISTAVGGLVIGNSYTLTQCAYIKNANGTNITPAITMELRQLSSGGPAATSINQVYPTMTGDYQLYSHSQSFQYLGGSIFFFVRADHSKPGLGYVPTDRRRCESPDTIAPDS